MQTTTQKEIKVRAIVVKNDFYPPTAGYPAHYTSSTADEDNIRNMLEYWCNSATPSFKKLAPASSPRTEVCGSQCYIEDAKLRIKLVGIDHVNPTENMSIGNKAMDKAYHLEHYGNADQDSVLNVFIVNYSSNGLTADNFEHSGLAYLPQKYDLNVAFDHHAIIMYGTYNYPWGSYPVFMHELGHALGLAHTHKDRTECVGFYVPVEDFLHDVFGLGTSFCSFPDSSYCDPYLPVNRDSCSNNLMGARYFSVPLHLSPTQLGRMHRAAFLSSTARFMYPSEAPDVTSWLITSTQEWDFGIRMYQNIIVKAGNTLTIKCEVQMPPGSKIIVEKGAKLVLDGGTITSYHPKATWAGIQLFGDKNAAPTAANQGSFEMKNEAIIEYAMTGVSDCIVPTWQGGGIIKVNNSTFKDCWKVANLHDYPSWSRSSSAIFDNVKFLNENPLALTNQTMTNVGLLSSFNEKDIIIKNCTFRNTLRSGNLKNSNYAVYGDDAGFRVTNCTFEGYKVGVYTKTVFNVPNRPVYVKNSTFSHSNRGILFADNFATAENNQFSNLSGYTDQPPNSMIPLYYMGEAIYADNAGGLTVIKNKINSGGEDFEFSRGITINNSKTIGARIVDNEINDLRYGITTQKNNPATDVLCNHFANGIYNIAINPESPNGLLKNQGNGCNEYFQYRAGNTFDGGNTYVYTNLINSWTYYSWANDMTQIPVNQSGTFFDIQCINGLGSQDPNSQCDLPGGIYERPGDFKDALTHWLSQSVLEQNSLMGLNTFDRLVRTVAENGNTADMIDLLEEMNTNETKKLLLSLLLETKNYSRFDAVLHEIDPYEGAEHDNLVTYYSVLKDLSVDNRQLWQLHTFEKDIINAVAAADVEVSPYAKALLETAYGEAWYHHQEQLEMDAMMGKTPGTTLAQFSQLFDAIPNPANQTTRIDAFLIEADAAKSYLIVRNMLGQVVYQQKLQDGRQSINLQLTQFGSGIYTYSLHANGKIIKTKRLVVQH